MSTTARSITGLVNDLSDEELFELVESSNRPLIKKLMARFRARRIRDTFVTPLEDGQVTEALKACLSGWRALATSLGYTGPVAWQVRKGFTLKAHASKAGPCYKNWDYLQTWGLRNDEPTKDSTVFWIPHLVEGSRSKSVQDQLSLLWEVRVKYSLPSAHLTSFGSAALLSGLILAHSKRTGDRVPLESLWARTDTFRESGYRLTLGAFDATGLLCDDWLWDDAGNGNLGVFPLGVELGV